MRNRNTPTDEQSEKIAFTDKQLRAIKAVDKAMRNADKVGVSFWDNYGDLTAYNRLKITCPNVTEDGEFEYIPGDYYEYIEEVYSKNFHAGNADDPLSFNII